MSKTPDKRINGLPDNDELIAGARATFRAACDSTDPYHALRLDLARRRALGAGAPRFAPRVWAPWAGGAVACCALAIGLFWLRPFAQPQVVQTASPGPVVHTAHGDADDTLAIGSSQMEMVEDLDFYRWLASQQDMRAPGGGSVQ